MIPKEINHQSEIFSGQNPGKAKETGYSTLWQKSFFFNLRRQCTLINFTEYHDDENVPEGLKM